MNIPDDVCRADIVVAIQEWVIGKNGERDRAIMTRRLIDGLTYEQLAEEFYLSDRQVKNIVYKRETQIFKHIRK